MNAFGEERETGALLASVRGATGLDFGGYAPSGIRRRLAALGGRDATSIAGLHARALADRAFMSELAGRLLVNVTALFRDPDLFLAYRAVALPHLRPGTPLRAWHAGCATGEEVWSHAIVLREEGLASGFRAYGTDVSRSALAVASAGLLPMDRMQEYTAAYRAAGGGGEFSSYYVAGPGGAAVHETLRAGVRFGRHDLLADRPFGAFDVVFCRNVLMYFDPPHQERAHGVLAASVRPGGILVLGRGEALSTSVRGEYEELDGRNRIFVRRG
ncbi:MAG TPA: CheR family methyltransferase [Anaeromyxobacter sp.]